ncbi:DUF616 domain-containing protein [Vibrio sp.]|nr:DUF616 domain-containing protein [Vibrio sp.]
MNIINKIVVYTVISGNYDEIKSVKKESNIDYICVTDNKDLDVPSCWEKLVIEDSPYKNHLFNRYYKLNPHVLFNNHDFSLYIDANIQVSNLIKDNLKDNAFCLYEHPDRSTVKDEVKVLKKVGYDYFFVFNKQTRKYIKSGFIDEILFEANILFRRHNEITEFSKLWFAELSNKEQVSRDQLSLTYSAQVSGLSLKSLGTHDARVTNKYFCYHNHLKRNPAMRYSVRFINILAKLILIDRM